MDDIGADETTMHTVEGTLGAVSFSTSFDCPWLSVEQAAAYLRVSRRTIYKLCAEFKLVYHESAGGRVFTKADLDNYIESGRVEIYATRRRKRRAA